MGKQGLRFVAAVAVSIMLSAVSLPVTAKALCKAEVKLIGNPEVKHIPYSASQIIVKVAIDVVDAKSQFNIVNWGAMINYTGKGAGWPPAESAPQEQGIYTSHVFHDGEARHFEDSYSQNLQFCDKDHCKIDKVEINKIDCTEGVR